MDTKNLIRVLGLALLALFVFGFIIGAIGTALFGGEDGEPFLPTPEVHLPPQPVLEADANEAEELHKLPNRFILTNTILSSLVASAVLILVFYFGTRNISADRPPKGLQNFVESIISGMYGFVESVAGPRYARPFFPLFATIFLYVIVNAWLGLLPLYQSFGFVDDGHLARHALRPAGTDLNMPLALALISFVFVEFWGIRALGLSYFGKFFRFGALLKGRIFEGVIDVFVGLLEALSEFIRIVSFTFRLFGNMTAGEILLLVTAFLIPFAFSLPFYGLELLVGFIQALIFAGLTLVFVTTAVTPHEHEAEEGH